MDINIQKSRDRTMAVAVMVLIAMTILSIGFNYKLYADYRSVVAELVNNKQIIIEPMISDDKGFSFNGERGDARYLRLMAMSFVSLRLDVSAQNVEHSHEILTGYLSDGLREKFIPVLSQEKQRLKINNGNSVFFVKKIQVSPSNGIVDIRGSLDYRYGINPVKPIDKHYQLRIETRNGKLELTDFVELQK